MPSTSRVDIPQLRHGHSLQWESLGVFEDFLLDIVDQRFQVFLGISLAFAIDKVINAHSCFEAVQLSFAQPFTGKINELERDASFPEIPLCFLCILAF
jgi:hypothetical protein